jgi:hypothetical protein
VEFIGFISRSGSFTESTIVGSESWLSVIKGDGVKNPGVTIVELKRCTTAPLVAFELPNLGFVKPEPPYELQLRKSR